MSINTQKLLGDLTPQQQPYSYGRRSDGRWSKVIYASLSQAQIDNIAAQADLLGINYEFQNNFGSRSEITLDYNWNFINNAFNSAATESEETWEIVPNKAMKDLLDSRNPLVVASDGENPQQANLLRNWKLNGTLSQKISVQSGTGEGDFKPPTIPGGSVFGSNGIVLAKFLYDGVESVEIPAPVMTHTKVVTAQYINPATFTNVGRIISTATLISSEGVPGGLLFDIASLPSTDPAPVPIPSAPGLYQAYLYGWLKNSPSVRQVAKRKWSITQEWDYGLWAIQIYGSVRL